MPLGSGMVGSSTPPVTIDTCIYGYLKPKLSAQLFPGYIPQDLPPNVPAFSYMRVSETPFYEGRGNSAGITQVTYQFDAFSQNYLEAGVMEQQLRMALHGFQGYMGPMYVTSRISNCTSQVAPPANSGKDWTFHYSSEYVMFVNEPFPDYEDHSPTVPDVSSQGFFAPGYFPNGFFPKAFFP